MEATMKAKPDVTRRAAKPLSWKARRRGRIFCAPACGRGCTAHEHRGAVHNAAALAKSLGPGWTPHVWENLGWHYAAISSCGRIRVLPNHRGYHAFLGAADGYMGGRWCENGRTPAAAVRNVIKAGRAHLADVGALVRGFESLLFALELA
jgi:hypothetical protein